MYTTLGMFPGTVSGGGGGGGSGGYPALLDVMQTVLTTGLSRSVVLPPAISAGQLILITNIGLGTSITAIPAGFSQLAASNNSVYKRAIGGEGGSSVTFTVGTSSGDTNFLAFVISNVHASQVPELALDIGSSSNVVPSAITATWGAASNLVVVSLNYARNASISNYPSNCTKYRETFTSASMDAAVCGEETALATFTPTAFTSAAESHSVRTIIIRGP